MKEEAQELSIAVVGYRVDEYFISAYGGKFLPVEPYLEDFSLIRKYQRYQTTNEGSTLFADSWFWHQCGIYRLSWLSRWQCSVLLAAWVCYYPVVRTE
jgi:hypothetical protein